MPLGYRIKFLINQLSNLEEQLVQTNNIFFEGVYEINSLLNKNSESEQETPEQEVYEESNHIDKKNENHEQGQEQPIKDDSPQNKIEPKIKKLFRKIAFRAHPDKLTGMPEGPEKEKLVALFQNAMRFSENNNYVNLAAIAIKLGIEIEDFSEKDLKIIKEKISIVKKKIKNLESTLIWKWIFEENDSVKEKILKKLLETMNEKSKKNSRP